MTILFIAGAWLFIVAVANLDIIHKASPIGEDLAKEYPNGAEPKGWQDHLFKGMMVVSCIMMIVPVPRLCKVL